MFLSLTSFVMLDRFLRSASHKFAIRKLLDKGLFPCAVSARNTNSGESFTNFNRVLYTYFLYYCQAEGLTRYHDLSRKVLVYLFHGTFKSPSECDVPVIRAIHKNMQTVAYRCVANMRSRTHAHACAHMITGSMRV